MKKSLIVAAIALASSAAHAEWIVLNETLTIGGDAEINFDLVRNKTTGLQDGTMTLNNTTTTANELNDDSRIKLMMQWKDTLIDGEYITAKIEPLVRTDGTVQVDDSYLEFGRDSLWYFQIGRYEAMDLFPLGKDTVVNYANGDDGMGSGIYYYMAKEGRGRAADAGQARIALNMGGFTAEVSTIYGNTAGIVEGAQKYINDAAYLAANATEDLAKSKITSTNNSFLIRPAVNFVTPNNMLSVSFGGEFEVKNSSVTVTFPTPQASGESVATTENLSDRWGLAGTATVNVGSITWNTSAAYQRAKDYMKSYTVNSNITWAAFGLGASYAHNEFVGKQTVNHDKAHSYIIYTAYSLPLLSFDDAEVTFAFSYSDTKNGYGIKGNDESALTFRTRFNYYF